MQGNWQGGPREVLQFFKRSASLYLRLEYQNYLSPALEIAKGEQTTWLLKAGRVKSRKAARPQTGRAKDSLSTAVINCGSSTTSPSEPHDRRRKVGSLLSRWDKKYGGTRRQTGQGLSWLKG